MRSLTMDPLQGMKIKNSKRWLFLFLFLKIMRKKYLLAKNGKNFKLGFLLQRSRHVLKQEKNAAGKLVKLMLVQLC